MDINKISDQNITVLLLSGRLMGQPETHILFENVRDLLAEGCTKIVIDLVGVNWINSLGIGAIMRCLSYANENKGRLFLSGLNEKINGIFNKTQLSKIFTIKESHKEATAELKGID